MNHLVSAVAFVLVIFAASVAAQVSPTPVINNEIREADSVRMRAVQLERMKRDVGKGGKIRPMTDGDAEVLQIREDFERIQTLQDEIVRIYKTSKRINFAKIEELSTELHKRSLRLETNLFGVERKKNEVSTDVSRDVRDLIIELDNNILKFVTGPIFRDARLVDSESANESLLTLTQIARLSDELSRAAALSR